MNIFFKLYEVPPSWDSGGVPAFHPVVYPEYPLGWMDQFQLFRLGRCIRPKSALFCVSALSVVIVTHSSSNFSIFLICLNYSAFYVQI